MKRSFSQIIEEEKRSPLYNRSTTASFSFCIFNQISLSTILILALFSSGSYFLSSKSFKIYLLCILNVVILITNTLCCLFVLAVLWFQLGWHNVHLPLLWWGAQGIKYRLMWGLFLGLAFLAHTLTKWMRWIYRQTYQVAAGPQEDISLT